MCAAIISDVYRTEFLTLLERLERDTGRLYSLSLYVQGDRQPLVLKSFAERSAYRVAEMEPEYAALQGQYGSVAAIKDKIAQLCYSGLEILPVDGDRDSDGIAQR